MDGMYLLGANSRKRKRERMTIGGEGKRRDRWQVEVPTTLMLIHSSTCERCAPLTTCTAAVCSALHRLGHYFLSSSISLSLSLSLSLTSSTERFNIVFFRMNTNIFISFTCHFPPPLPPPFSHYFQLLREHSGVCRWLLALTMSVVWRTSKPVAHHIFPDPQTFGTMTCT